MRSRKCELIVVHDEAMTEMDEIAEMEVGDLLGVGFGLIVLVIGIAIGLQLVGDTQDDFGVDACAARTDGFTSYNVTAKVCYNSSGSTSAPGSLEWNATQQGKEAVALIPKKLKIIVTVIIASVLIGLLVRHLWRSYMG